MVDTCTLALTSPDRLGNLFCVVKFDLVSKVKVKRDADSLKLVFLVCFVYSVLDLRDLRQTSHGNSL